MIAIGGMIFILICVFGSYIASGGNIEAVLEALPHELITIGGAAVGTYLIANSMEVVKRTKDISKVIKGPKWAKDDYRDLLCLCFTLIKLIRSKGMIAAEAHIENPHESSIFQRYPKIMHDHFAVELICDYLRMMTMNLDDPHQVEEILERELEKHHHETVRVADALTTISDGLPALGIVAAVLGVIKTMGSINEPPAILGRMIGGALVGTFLGVMLAYGFVGPIATRLKGVYAEDHAFYTIIRDMIVANLHGCAPQVSVEIGRKNVPTRLMPTFQQLEEAIDAIPPA